MLVSLLCELVQRCQATQIEVVSAEIMRWFFPRERDLCVFQLWRDGAYDARGDLILKVENVFETAVEAIRPKVSIRRNLDQLPRNANFISGLPYAPLQYVANTQLAADLLDII